MTVRVITGGGAGERVGRLGIDRRMVRAVMASPSNWVGAAIVGFVLVMAVVGPQAFGAAAVQLNASDVYASPSTAHVLGTNALGQDVFARLMVASRLTLILGLGGAGVGVAFGALIGGTAVVSPPRVRGVLLRVIDTLMSFPALLIAVFLITIIGPGATGAIIGVGAAESFYFARMISSMGLSIAEREYVAAARVLGVKRGRLLLRYILPNEFATIVIAGSAAVSQCIVIIAAMSFLGLGVQFPQYDWGRLLADGVSGILSQPWGALGPALAIALLAMGFGLLGEGLAGASDPRSWGTTQRAKRVDSELAWSAWVGLKRGRGSREPRRNDARESLEGGQSSSGVGLLSIRNLTVAFVGSNAEGSVLSDVSFDLAPAEILGIVGESGSGKSTLALAIGRLLARSAAVSGEVLVLGRNIYAASARELRRDYGGELGYVFQDPLTAFNPLGKLGSQLTFGVRAHRGLSRSAARALARDRIREVHLSAGGNELDAYPDSLSGGMRQRLAIAGALMTDPKVLVADEPTTALDVGVQAEIMRLLLQLREDRQLGIVLISHNLAMVSELCDRVLVMYAGRVVEELSIAELRSGAMHPYTRALIACLPEASTLHGEPLRSIAGEPADPANPPAGCAFHPRCSLAIERCRVERPELRVLSGSNVRRCACHRAGIETEDDTRARGPAAGLGEFADA